MSRNTYSYYDYLNKYDARFLNKYQSHTHWVSGRGSHFMELLRFKARRVKNDKNFVWFDVRMGKKFLLMVFLPNFLFVTFMYALTPVWKKTDERYHLRYGDGENDEIEDIEPFVTYQMRKKPLTRKKYSDAVKLIYDGIEE